MRGVIGNGIDEVYFVWEVDVWYCFNFQIFEFDIL